MHLTCVTIVSRSPTGDFHRHHAQAERDDPDRLQQRVAYITMSVLLALVGFWDEQYGPLEDIFLGPRQQSQVSVSVGFLGTSSCQGSFNYLLVASG